MKHHTLFVIFEKSSKIFNCRLLQIKGGALGLKDALYFLYLLIWPFEHPKDNFYGCQIALWDSLDTKKVFLEDTHVWMHGYHGNQ